MTPSLADIVASAPPDDVYLEDARSARAVRFGELASSLRSAASWFAARPEQHRIAVDVDDAVDLAVTHLAVIAAGRFSAPLDPRAPKPEQRRNVEAMRCDLVVSDRPQQWDGRDSVPVVHPHAITAEPVGTAAPDVEVGGVLMQTSGSTGRPKIVRLSTEQLLATARSVATNLRLEPGDRGYNPLPLFHINGQVVGVLATLLGRSTLVLDRGFHRTGFWELMDARRITWINAVPAILTILLRDLPEHPPEGLRLVRSASAPLPGSVRTRLETALQVPLIESYGMTEAGSQITAGAPDGSTPAGSVGNPTGTDVAIRDAGADGVGRIWIRGPGVIGGYEDGRAAERFDGDGWLDTGDDGRLGDRGELYIVGRADDQINRGGELIYPSEIEDVLRGDDRVLEVAVVGRPDETLGQVPVAFVIARGAAGDELTDDLAERAARELSRHKRPADIRLVTEFPRVANGKVKRAALRESVDGAVTGAEQP